MWTNDIFYERQIYNTKYMTKLPQDNLKKKTLSWIEQQMLDDLDRSVDWEEIEDIIASTNSSGDGDEYELYDYFTETLKLEI